MTVNRGKQFEEVIRNCFEKVKNTTVTRLPDPTNGYLGIRNISDFIVYHYPYQYFIECKSIHGNTFPFSNVSKNQREGMTEVSKKEGVKAGLIIWWIDKDITVYYPIQAVERLRLSGFKSIRYDLYKTVQGAYRLDGQKKRVFFDYDMGKFFKEVGYGKI